MGIWDIAGAIIEGVVSVPVDVYYGSKRTLEDVGLFGRDVQKQNAAERERLFALLKKAISNPKVIERIIRIIVSDFVEVIPPAMMDKINDSLTEGGAKFGARKITQFSLAGFISSRLVGKIITRQLAKRAAKFGVGFAVSALLIQGTLERSSNASKRLLAVNPRVHRKLKSAKLDLIYFIVEEEMAPFVSIDALKLRDPDTYREFIKNLEGSLN